MIRITNNYLANNFLKNVNEQRDNLANYQKQLTSGEKIQRPYQDPDGTSQALKYRTQVDSFNRYGKNAGDAISKLQFVDAKLQETKEYLDQVRDKAVQGASGTYNKSDMQKMASEVDQMLKQMIEVANSSVAGESVFGGYQTDTKPFEVEMGRHPETGETVVTKVKYQGDLGRIKREIDRGEYIDVNVPGNRAFWATNQRIISNTDVQGYTAAKDQTFKINGVTIEINQGDNVNAITDKINQAGLDVKAELDDTKKNASIVTLQSTKPGQIILEDYAGGTVLQDLGFIVDGGGITPANNYAPSASVNGSSMFDAVINLRDSLINGDTEAVNRGVGEIDQAIDNVLSYNSEVGAKSLRAELVQKRMSQLELYAKDFYSKIQGLDMADAITEMKNMQFMHEATLNVGSRLIPRTLLDFLR